MSIEEMDTLSPLTPIQLPLKKVNPKKQVSDTRFFLFMPVPVVGPMMCVFAEIDIPVLNPMPPGSAVATKVGSKVIFPPPDAVAAATASRRLQFVPLPPLGPPSGQFVGTPVN